MGTYKLKMLLIGDAAVGKTSLIKKFIKGAFQKDYKMTIGCDIFTKDVELNDGQDLVTLSIWDIAGQDRFKFFRSSFYRGSAGAMVIFDLTRYTTFNPNVVNWLKELWSFTGRIPIVILGNKVDLINMRAVRASDAKAFADQVPCDYIETSAKEGQYVDESFSALAMSMLQNMRNKMTP
ncbi:MAG: GTP-binding protein [Candidatus Helarchaeota archaeon]|nr:GTP-binding protein [Candidatus Helarchaeota archaeon]